MTTQEKRRVVNVAVGARYKADGSSSRSDDWDKLITDLDGAVPETTLDYINTGDWPSQWNFFATPEPSRYVRLSFKSLSGPWRQYLTTVPEAIRPKLLLVWRHEHERPTEPWGGTDSAGYRAEFTQVRDAIKTAAPWAKVGMSSSGNFYRPANNGADANAEWFPPDADFYSLDTYQTGRSATGMASIRPFEEAVEFQSWNRQRLLRPEREWHITEYGRGVADGAVAGTPARRLEVMAQDLVYLKTLGCKSLTYFLAEGPESTPTDLRDWKPRAQDWADFTAAFATAIRN